MDDQGFPASDDSAQMASSPAERLRGAGMSSEQNNEEDPEIELWEGTYSGKAMVGQWLLGVLAAIGVPILLIVMGASATIWKIAMILVAVGWLALALLMCYRKLSHKYELTTQRFKHRAGIFTRMSDRIELIDIDDVSCKQGIIQAMMGVGTVIIESSDTSHPRLTLYGIDNVKDVTDKIDDSRRTERRKRGIHIESI